MCAPIVRVERRPLRTVRSETAAVAFVALLGACAAPVKRTTASPVVPGIASETAERGTDLDELLQAVYERCSPIDDGANADYIPALAAADPERFGIALVTVDGAVHTVGDCETPFAIMSAAKPFTAALVMQQRGVESIVEQIGVEPTGEAFNSVLAIELHEQRSMNPMVNAGAIAAVSMLQTAEGGDRWSTLSGFYDRLAGEELHVLDDVLESVSTTNHRNRAIANLLYSYERLYCDPADALEVYNRQSCVAVNARQLAQMAATLASGGVRPADGTRVIEAGVIDEVLALMCVAGFYDESGLWAYTVGLPSKSGVGGGIYAIAPGRFAVAAWSPRLNSSGNSVRASAAIREIAQRLDAGLFHIPETPIRTPR